MANVKVRVELNNAALRALATPVVQRSGEAIAAAAGEGFAFDIQQGQTRPHGVVKATNYKAIIRNRRDNTLLKAVAAGRVG